MKTILLLISFVSLLVANTMNITKDFSSESTQVYQTIVEDKNNNITALDLFADRYQSNYLKDKVGYAKNTFWSK